MKQIRLLVLGLVFGVWCLWKIETWSRPNFCHDPRCPKYTVIKKYGDIEMRSYVVTTEGKVTHWPFTPVHGNSSEDLEEAKTVLRNYTMKDKGYDIGSSPVILSLDGEINLAWYAPPDTKFNTEDPRVKMIYNYHPKATFFVRPFSGEPTVQNARDKASELRKNLEKLGIGGLADQFAAFYGSFSSPSQYKEGWIFQYPQ